MPHPYPLSITRLNSLFIFHLFFKTFPPLVLNRTMARQLLLLLLLFFSAAPSSNGTMTTHDRSTPGPQKQHRRRRSKAEKRNPRKAVVVFYGNTAAATSCRAYGGRLRLFPSVLAIRSSDRREKSAGGRNTSDKGHGDETARGEAAGPDFVPIVSRFVWLRAQHRHDRRVSLPAALAMAPEHPPSGTALPVL